MKDWEKAIDDCGFKRNYKSKYDYEYNDGTWTWCLNYEGYAYVLYMMYRGQEVPIAHFRDSRKLITIMEILTDKLD